MRHRARWADVDPSSDDPPMAETSAVAQAPIDRDMLIDPPLSLAVLPFRAAAHDRLAVYFAERLRESLIAAMRATREAAIVAPPHRGDMRTVATMYGARYAITGSVRGSGAALRVFVELSHAGSGVLIWSSVLETRDLMLFDAQDQIAGQIVTALTPRVHFAELARIRGKHPAHMSAYDCVLQARALMYRFSDRSFREAGVLLRQALAMEPTHPVARRLYGDWQRLWADPPRVPDVDPVVSEARAEAMARA